MHPRPTRQSRIARGSRPLCHVAATLHIDDWASGIGGCGAHAGSTAASGLRISQWIDQTADVLLEWARARQPKTSWSEHLGAQTAGGRLVPVYPVCEDTSASALPATQPLYKSCYRRWRYAKIGQIFIAQKAIVAATQASHMHDEFSGLHDQSSSDSRATAGAAGFLILTQCGDRPDLYGEPAVSTRCLRSQVHKRACRGSHRHPRNVC